MLSLSFNVKFDLHNRYHKGVFLSFVSLLFVVLLFTACFVSVFSGFSPFASGVEVTVSDQNALKTAVVSAPLGLGSSYVIALNADIYLTGSLIIPAGKNITLTNDGGVVCSLIALINNVDTIVVNGVLVLDGITVTHANSFSGSGVTVNNGGIFIMKAGEVSGNTASGRGGGVCNNGGGVFEMFGGKISNNAASEGGGVFNSGSFRMFDGVILDNSASGRGAGVLNFAGFVMYDGKISGNNGVGVHTIWPASFSLFGGEISFNTDTGVFLVSGFFNMDGGVISNNTGVLGGGVYMVGCNFTMTGGVISGNSATLGGGVYVGADSIGNCAFYLSGGEISNNVALNDGGGVWVELGRLDRIFVSDGVVFSNNRASVAYDRDPIFDYIYNSHIGRNVVWSSPFTQGYNNYDVSFVYGESITKYAVDVRGSYAVTTSGGSYAAGAVVTVNAGARDGYMFSGWTVNEGDVTLSNSTLQVASFTMPANNVSVTANWRFNSDDDHLPTNSTSTPKPSNPTPSGSVPNSPKPNNSALGGEVIVFPSPSGKWNLLEWSFRNIVLVVCVVLVTTGIVGVLLHKRSKA